MRISTGIAMTAGGQITALGTLSAAVLDTINGVSINNGALTAVSLSTSSGGLKVGPTFDVTMVE